MGAAALSIVVPVYNEQAVLPVLLTRIDAVRTHLYKDEGILEGRHRSTDRQ